MCSAYSEAQLQAVRDALPEYLRRVHGITNLRRPFRCLKPGHEDKHPSMSYDVKRNRVKCFACGAAGDIFDVAGWDAGTEVFTDKVAAAADGAGVALSDVEQRTVCKPVAQPRQPLAQVQGENVLSAVVNAALALFDHPAALNLLHERGFTDEEINCRYGFGWVKHPNNILPGRFDSAPTSEQGYIVLPFPDNEAWESVRYCTFRPIGKSGNRKELKPAGLPSMLWREHVLKGSVETVYICEGVFDACAIIALLNVQACAMCGDNVSRVLDIIADVPRENRPACIIALDSDDAGKRMAEQLLERLRGLGVPSSVGPVPDGFKDWNEVLKHERA